jgi:hypothetical protein
MIPSSNVFSTSLRKAAMNEGSFLFGGANEFLFNKIEYFNPQNQQIKTKFQRTLNVEILVFGDSQKVGPSLLTLLQSCELEFFQSQFPLALHLHHSHLFPLSSLIGSISGKQLTEINTITDKTKCAHFYQQFL